VTPTYSGPLKSVELEAQLKRALGLPADVVQPPAGGVPNNTQTQAFTSHRDYSRLRQALAELRHRTAIVGLPPRGYPRHLGLIMRGIAALLPWYTRTLREQAASVEQVSFALFDAITLIGQRVDELDTGMNTPPPRNHDNSHPDKRN
jgi:hypothetical protein